jgi:hypothetical protein
MALCSVKAQWQLYFLSIYNVQNSDFKYLNPFSKTDFFLEMSLAENSKEVFQALPPINIQLIVTKAE